MTSLYKLSALSAITLGAALSMTAGLAIAGEKVSADQILNALQPKKPLTRGLSAGPQADPAVEAKQIRFVDTLRNRKTRSLSLGEREEIAEIAASKPNGSATLIATSEVSSVPDSSGQMPKCLSANSGVHSLSNSSCASETSRRN